MSPVKKLTASAMVTAACVALLYTAALAGQIRLALTALAGILPAAAVILCGPGWALGCFAGAGLLALFLLPDKSAALWFLGFFGHYPVWKMAIERLQTRLGKPLLGWAMKLAGFCLCMAAMYLLFKSLFLGAVPAAAAEWALPLLGLVLLACFAAYDVAFSILIGYFRINILPKLR